MHSRGILSWIYTESELLRCLCLSFPDKVISYESEYDVVFRDHQEESMDIVKRDSG